MFVKACLSSFTCCHVEMYIGQIYGMILEQHPTVRSHPLVNPEMTKFVGKSITNAHVERYCTKMDRLCDGEGTSAREGMP